MDSPKRTVIDVRAINVLAIQNFGSSGSMFLQSLLDSHPNIASTPGLYSRDFYNFWQSCGHLRPLEIATAFVRGSGDWFHPLGGGAHGMDKLGEEMNQNAAIPVQPYANALVNLFSHLLKNNAADMSPRKAFFMAVHLAYAAVLRRELREPLYILFPIHSQPDFHARCLLEDFPAARFLYTVRNPLSCIASAVNHIIFNDLPVHPGECAVAQIINNVSKHWSAPYIVKGDRPYFDGMAEACRAVRLEDLHARPRDVMQAVCTWLNMPWDDCLLQSTFNGKKWWNRPESPRISGFSKEITGNQHQGVLSDFDRLRLYATLSKRCQAWNYPVPRLCSNFFSQLLLGLTFLLPFRLENAENRGPDIFKQRQAALMQQMMKAPRVLKFFAAIAKIRLCVTDYFMIRRWLYRGLFVEQREKRRHEVALLPLEHGASEAPAPGAAPAAAADPQQVDQHCTI